jgi:cell division protein DivIC
MKFPKIPNIPPFLKNKYVIVIIIAIVWLLFFDNNNIFQQFRFSGEIKRLKSEKAYYIKEIEKDSIMRHELKENPEALEKFAREQYFMKKEGEDIFIVKQDQH